MTVEPIVLTLPGRFNSGPQHWQSIWENQRDNCSRVELGLWDAPQRNVWVNKINHAVRRHDRPIIIAAHGLACVALVWWAALNNPGWQQWIAGALLVAPTEASLDGYDVQLESFGPTPRSLLPFPSIVVASQNDPKVPFERAKQLARYWGSSFANAGEVGHINGSSNVGSWRWGQTLLTALATDAIRSYPEPHGDDLSPPSDRLEDFETASLWARDQKSLRTSMAAGS